MRTLAHSFLLLSVCIALVFALGTASAGLNDGLVAYYPFNGNAKDESGTGNNGTVNGATLTADRFGVPSSAYSFDGIDDFIEVLHHDTLNMTDNLTITVWVNYNQIDRTADGFDLGRPN